MIHTRLQALALPNTPGFISSSNGRKIEPALLNVLNIRSPSRLYRQLIVAVGPKHQETDVTYHYQMNQWGDHYIDALNPTVFAHTQASAYYELKMGVDFSATDTLHIVIGTDSGLYLKYAQSLEIGKGSRIVFVEPDPVYDFINENLPNLTKSTDAEDDGQSAPVCSFLRQSNWVDQLTDGSFRFWFIGGNVNLAQSSACESDYTQLYFPLYRQALTEIENYSVNIRRMTGVKTFVETQMCNAADNSMPLLIDTEFGHGHTAIVLGGSPSLDEHIEWIMENRERLFIIAVSRICTKLVSLNLKPDLLIAIDPHPFSYDVSKKGLLWDDVPMINNYHLAPQMLQEWRGPKFYMGPRLPWTEVVENQPVAGGPTVGHTCIIVAAHFGFSNILLAGIDLCYAPDGVTHSAASPEAIFHQLPCLYDAKVQTYRGQTAGTSLEFLNSIEALNTIGATINKNTPVVFNLCLNAARVESIDYIERQNVTLPDSKPDFHHMSARLPVENKHSDLTELKRQVDLARIQFRLIVKTCKEALALVRKMYSDNSTKSQAVYSQRLDKLEARMETDSAKYLRTIRHYLLSDFSQQKKPRDFIDLSESEKESWIRQYYQITRKGALQFIEMLNDLEQRIELRLIETRRTTQLQTLLDAWMQDNTPGRIFQKCSVLESATEKSDLDSIENYKNAFLESINDNDTGHAQSLKDINTNIDECIRTLTFLSSNEDVEDLDLLSTRLNSDAWPSNVIKCFCDGLIANLQNNPSAALNQFQTIIDICSENLANGLESIGEMHRLIEESLSRMTRIYLGLGDEQSACSALGTLCELQPHYIPTYAKLLNLSGKHEHAIALLEVCLETFPGNWRAAALIADIHGEHGQLELSRLASDRSVAIRTKLSKALKSDATNHARQSRAA